MTTLTTGIWITNPIEVAFGKAPYYYFSEHGVDGWSKVADVTVEVPDPDSESLRNASIIQVTAQIDKIEREAQDKIEKLRKQLNELTGTSGQVNGARNGHSQEPAKDDIPF